MSKARYSCRSQRGKGTALAVLLFLLLPAQSFAQNTTGPRVIIRVRLAGEDSFVVPLRACLERTLAKYPDVETVWKKTEGIRFTADILTSDNAKPTETVSMVVVGTFPIEQFRPKLKEGEDADALLGTVRYYTLQRLHELIPPSTEEQACERIASDIHTRVLEKEYVERDD